MCGIAQPTDRWLRLRQQIGVSWRDLCAIVGGVLGLTAGFSLWQLWQNAVRFGTPGPLRFAFVLLVALTGLGVGRLMGGLRLALGLGIAGLVLATPTALHAEWLRTWPEPGVGSLLTVTLGAFGWLVGRVYGPTYADAWWEERRPRSVLEMRAFLTQRQMELSESLTKMKALGQRLAQQNPDNPHMPALETLRAAYHASEQQLQRHTVDGWQVTMAVWQNAVQPILASWRQMDAREAEHAAATLEKLAQTGTQTVEEWRKWPADLRGQRTIAQMTDLIAGVEHLREAVMLRQAVALAQASPGIHEAFMGRELPVETQTQIENLRQGAVLSEISASVPELAHERERLRVEHAAIGEVERLMKD